MPARNVDEFQLEVTANGTIEYEIYDRDAPIGTVQNGLEFDVYFQNNELPSYLYGVDRYEAGVNVTPVLNLSDNRNIDLSNIGNLPKTFTVKLSSTPIHWKR